MLEGTVAETRAVPYTTEYNRHGAAFVTMLQDFTPKTFCPLLTLTLTTILTQG